MEHLLTGYHIGNVHNVAHNGAVESNSLGGLFALDRVGAGCLQKARSRALSLCLELWRFCFFVGEETITSGTTCDAPIDVCMDVSVAA